MQQTVALPVHERTAREISGEGNQFSGGCAVTYAALLLHLLDTLLHLGLAAVGLVQGDLQLVDVRLQLLLHTHGLGLALGFSLQRGLHGVQGTLVVAAAGQRERRDQDPGTSSKRRKRERERRPVATI